jgi:hypothetical protein
MRFLAVEEPGGPQAAVAAASSGPLRVNRTAAGTLMLTARPVRLVELLHADHGTAGLAAATAAEVDDSV